MDFREFIDRLQAQGRLATVAERVPTHLAPSSILKKFDGQPVSFYTPDAQRVVGNVFGTRALMAESLVISPKELILKLLHALDHPSPPPVLTGAPPCQEVVTEDVDLYRLPIIHYYADEGGPYITAGIFVVRDVQWGFNLSYHRCLLLGKDRFAIRVLPRHLHAFLQRAPAGLDAALIIGNPPCVTLAGAASPALGVSEYDVAHTLAPFTLAHACTSDLLVPAASEYVLEGKILHEETQEGPFVDITGAMDIVRPGPVFKVHCLTHRRDPLYHALLPAGLEHKILMGLPKETDIFRAVREVCDVRAVHVTPGGASWLHAVVQIDKKAPDDPRKAIQAAFKGHGSLKHVFVVDTDVDPFDPSDVEWAMATRFRADQNLLLMPGEKGSSLDPSADPLTRKTCKAGFDLTCPLGEKKAAFSKIPCPSGPSHT